jgi:hypothetical protein
LLNPSLPSTPLPVSTLWDFSDIKIRIQSQAVILTAWDTLRIDSTKSLYGGMPEKNRLFFLSYTKTILIARKNRCKIKRKILLKGFQNNE